MSPEQSSLATRVRELNDAPASTTIADVASVLNQSSLSHGPHLRSLDSPRERFILVVIAAFPNARVEQIADMTAMSVATVKQSIHDLLQDGCIYATGIGCYMTTSAAVVA